MEVRKDDIKAIELVLKAFTRATYNNIDGDEILDLSKSIAILADIKKRMSEDGKPVVPEIKESPVKKVNKGKK